MVELDSLRRYAGADSQTDTEVLTTCLQWAIEWYRSAGVPPLDGNALYDDWVRDLAAWRFDNRGGDAPIPAHIVSSVHQMRRAAAKAAAK